MAVKKSDFGCSKMLLLGNGVNLVAGRNSHLLMSAVEVNYHTEDGIPEAKFFKDCRQLRPTFVHYALAALRDKVDGYYTTNYDYAMERSLYSGCLKPKKGQASTKVIHIHGEAKKPDACIFTEAQYLRELISIESKDWYRSFMSQEIHICGLALRQTELLLYHILRERRRKIEEMSDFEYKDTIKPIYAWLTYTEAQKEETERLADSLRGLSVRPVLVPVHGDDYVSAWQYLIGCLMMHLSRIHVSSADSRKIKAAKNPQSVSRGLNVSYSSVPCLKYPERVHIKIRRKTLQNHAHQKYWFFYCEIDLKLYIWQLPIEDLLRFSSPDQRESYFHLYLNYTQGAVYYAPRHSRQIAYPVATCTRISNALDFDHFFQP